MTAPLSVRTTDIAADAALGSGLTAGLASTQNAEHLLAIEQGILGLFDRLKRSNATKLLGGREGLFKKHRPAETAAEKDVRRRPQRVRALVQVKARGPAES